MTRLCQTSFLGVAAALAVSASGCLVEHGGLIRDEPAPLAPAPQYSASRDLGDEYGVEDAPAAAPARPGVDVGGDDYFDDRLAPYGRWQTTVDGRVWVPNDVGADFRPYDDGHWAYTDYGWTYASPLPWAWACYHYGSWGFGVGIGWYWLPGRVWGPAWVNWRWGGGYVAWSPLGPGGRYWASTSPAWTVVGERHFTQPIRAVALNSRAAAGIVARTSPQATGRAGGSFGPPVGRISAAVGHPISAVPVGRVVPGANPRALSRAGAAPYQRGAASPRADSWGRASRQQPGSRWSSPGRAGANRFQGGQRGYPAARPGAAGRYGGARGGSRPGGAARGGAARGGGSSAGHSSGGSSGHSGGGHSSGGKH